MVLACTGYTTDWLLINFLVILFGLALVAVLYALSRIMPSSVKYRIANLTRTEITQAFLSALIIMILLVSADAACTITTSISPNQDPFSFSQTYVTAVLAGNNGGLSILTSIYSYSFAYGIISGTLRSGGAIFGQLLSGALTSKLSSIASSSVVSLQPVFGFNLGEAYGLLSDFYLDVLAPITVVAIGLVFVQYLALIVVQQTAFTIVLPVALIVRAIPFSGPGLRNAGNAFLAIAIAAYLIYPMTVEFDSYAITWIYTVCHPYSPAGSCNPSAIYLSPYYYQLISNQFFTQAQAPNQCVGTSAGTACGLSPAQIYLNADPTMLALINYGAVETVVHDTVTNMAIFLFQSVMMFAVNLSITLGFAVGLTRALDAGIEGAGAFWGSL